MDECKDLVRKTRNKDAQADIIERIAPISKVTVNELADSINFESRFDELIERLPLYDILLMPGMVQNFDLWDLTNRVLKIANNKYRFLAPVTTPILSAIRYRYDYGDNWNIKNIAIDCYDSRNQ